MQPTFLPWLGYFDIIDQCDTFVFLDNFQLSRRSFHTRNRMSWPTNSEMWLTLPVRNRGPRELEMINSAEPVDVARTVDRISGQVRSRFRRSSARDDVIELIRQALGRSGASLADINIEIISRIAEGLGIATSLLRSSELETGQVGQLRRWSRLREILVRSHWGSYLCASGARQYMEEERITEEDRARIRFHEYVCVAYEQPRMSEFHSHMSVLDTVASIGWSGTIDVLREGRRPSSSWS